MFEHPTLITILLILLTLCALIYLIKETYYFSLDLNQKEERVNDEEDTSYTFPSPKKWVEFQHKALRESINYELAKGGRMFIPSSPELLDQQVFNNVLNEMHERGYSTAVKTSVDGYIRSVTFDVSEVQKPSEPKEVGGAVLGYDAFVFENAFTPSESDVYVVSLPKGITNTPELLDTFYRMLNLPEYFGFNWDALSDCLRDLHWIKRRTIVLRHSDLPALPESELRIYLDVLSEAVVGWHADEEHSLVVSFPYDAMEELELRFPRK